jgi:CPA1 family monovalent cation:H+ antiporter
MCKSIDNYQVEILISLALAAGGFALADHLGLSAPLAVVCAGLLMGNHGRTFAMSPKTVERLDSFWEMIDDCLNAILFTAIGLEMLVLDFSLAYLVAGAAAVATVLVARFATVGLTLSAIRPWYVFAPRTIIISTWAGLRVGISVALALSLPGQHSGASLPERDIIVSMTYVVVVFSILVQGLTVGPLVRCLNRGRPTAEHLGDRSGAIG